MSDQLTARGFAPEHEICENTMQPCGYVCSIVDYTDLEKICDVLRAYSKCDTDSADTIKQALLQLTISTLIIDDIEQGRSLLPNSQRPCAHLQYGVDRAVSAANYAYFLAMQKLSLLTNKQESMTIYSTELLRMHRGKGRDLYWRKISHFPSIVEYKEMVVDRDGAILRMAARLMFAQVAMGDCEPVVSVLDSLSYFQDVCRLRINATESTTGHVPFSSSLALMFCLSSSPCHGFNKAQTRQSSEILELAYREIQRSILLLNPASDLWSNLVQRLMFTKHRPHDLNIPRTLEDTDEECKAEV